MDADSILHLEEPIRNNCVITLGTLQYFFYCSGHIDIQDPDGNRLESIGYGIKRDNIESSIYRLKEQIYILECLLCKLITAFSYLRMPSLRWGMCCIGCRGFVGIILSEDMGGWKAAHILLFIGKEGE